MSLPRERTIPNKPRFGFVTEKAYEFLLEYGYSSFPISPFKVLKDLSEYVTCLPWSEAKKVLHSRDPFHLFQKASESIAERHDWLLYPYWNYLKMRITSDIDGRPDELKAAALYSSAFVDDDGNLIVIADTSVSAMIINTNKELILKLINETDEIEYKGLEACTPDDL